MQVIEVIEKAKEKTGSDYATALRVGVDRTVVSAWRRGKNRPDLIHGIRLCNVAGVDPRELDGVMQTASQQQQSDAGNTHYARVWRAIVAAFRFVLQAPFDNHAPALS